MYTYIKFDHKDKYVTFKKEMDPTYFKVGSTYKDYVNGSWVLLSEDQLKFRDEHPNASVQEVFNMKLNELPKRTINQAINEMMESIIAYDSSDEVNTFYIGDLSVWLDKATRAGLKLRFEAEIAIGQTDTILWYNNMQFPLTLENAIQMLYAIEIYASACYDNTQRHMAEVSKLTTLEEIDSYDYTLGYPEKLQF